MTHEKQIHYDGMFSILPIPYCMTCKDLTACIPNASSQVTSELEMGSTIMLIFQISRTCLIPSPSRTFYLKELLIGKPSFASRQCSAWRLLFICYLLQSGSTSLCPRDKPFPWGPARQTHIINIPWGEPVSFMSTRWTCFSYILRGKSLLNVVALLDFSYLIGSDSLSRCRSTWRRDFLLQTVARPSPFLSWPSLMPSFLARGSQFRCLATVSLPS